MKMALREKILTLTILLNLVIMPPSAGATRTQRTYPEEVHRRVLAKLGKNDDSLFTMGHWAEWSSWSSCSRSCENGVKIQSRVCFSRNRTNMEIIKEKTIKCIGNGKRYQLCNTQDCKNESKKDFREEQCTNYDNKPFNKIFYKWKPYIENIDSCTLNCRPKGHQFYATLNATVIDGTPCGNLRYRKRPESFCVEGKCIKMGCDNLLGSGRNLDICGLCGGDNSTCRLISGIFSKTQLPFGFNLIATIPKGTRNISFLQMKPTTNVLAIREQSGDYSLNGPFGKNISGIFVASGTSFTYVRPNSNVGDFIYSRGPTKRPLDIMLFFQGINSGIKYEYLIPADVLKNPEEAFGRISHSGPINDAQVSNSITRDNYKSRNKYRDKNNSGRQLRNKPRKRFLWVPQGFTSCTHSCGGGIQATRYICVRKKRQKKQIPSEFCAHLDLPDNRIYKCNFNPCSPQWQPGKWSPCSVTCGLGVRLRRIYCSRKMSTNQTVNVPDYLCEQIASPHISQVCQMGDCDGPPKWTTDQWSPCSSPCGLGTRKRNVTCQTVHGILQDEKCLEGRPPDEEICDMGSCATDTWLFSDWEKRCQGPCTEGFQTRIVHCSGNAFDTTQNSCSKSFKPIFRRPCDNLNKCSGSWFTGPWTECNVNCGPGQQTRTVVCVIWIKGKYKVAKDNSFCKSSGEKPTDARLCTADCQLQWFTSNWSECSRSCDGGVQRREIKCLDEFLLPSLECDRLTKPDSRQSCNTQTCNTKVGSPRYEDFNNSNLLLPQDSADESSLFPSGSCMDRMKNCNLVFKARLCKLRYYYQLCCQTCSKQ